MKNSLQSTELYPEFVLKLQEKFCLKQGYELRHQFLSRSMNLGNEVANVLAACRSDQMTS